MKCRKIVLTTGSPILLSESREEDVEGWKRDSRQVTHYMSSHCTSQSIYLPLKGPSRNGNTTLCLYWQTEREESFHYSLWREGRELHQFKLSTEHSERYCRHFLYLDASESNPPKGLRLNCQRESGAQTFVTIEIEG